MSLKRFGLLVFVLYVFLFFFLDPVGTVLLIGNETLFLNIPEYTHQCTNGEFISKYTLCGTSVNTTKCIVCCISLNVSTLRVSSSIFNSKTSIEVCITEHTSSLPVFCVAQSIVLCVLLNFVINIIYVRPA